MNDSDIGSRTRCTDSNGDDINYCKIHGAFWGKKCPFCPGKGAFGLHCEAPEDLPKVSNGSGFV